MHPLNPAFDLRVTSNCAGLVILRTSQFPHCFADRTSPNSEITVITALLDLRFTAVFVVQDTLHRLLSTSSRQAEADPVWSVAFLLADISCLCWQAARDGTMRNPLQSAANLSGDLCTLHSASCPGGYAHKDYAKQHSRMTSVCQRICTRLAHPEASRPIARYRPLQPHQLLV